MQTSRLPFILLKYKTGASDGLAAEMAGNITQCRGKISIFLKWSGIEKKHLPPTGLLRERISAFE
jgi:hypothetical protein